MSTRMTKKSMDIVCAFKIYTKQMNFHSCKHLTGLLDCGFLCYITISTRNLFSLFLGCYFIQEG